MSVSSIVPWLFVFRKSKSGEYHKSFHYLVYFLNASDLNLYTQHFHSEIKWFSYMFSCLTLTASSCLVTKKRDDRPRSGVGENNGLVTKSPYYSTMPLFIFLLYKIQHVYMHNFVSCFLKMIDIIIRMTNETHQKTSTFWTFEASGNSISSSLISASMALC